MEFFYRFIAYFTFKLKEVDQHSLHSPFLYNLYTKKILPARKFSESDDDLKITRSSVKLKYLALIKHLSDSPEISTAVIISPSEITAPYFSKQLIKGSTYFFVRDSKPFLPNLDMSGINIIEGDIPQTLTSFLKDSDKIDMALIDLADKNIYAEGIYEQIKSKMSPGSIFFLKDIHRSGMSRRYWEKIKALEKNNLVLDFYQIGVVIRGNDLPVGYYPLYF